jgi:hypothetical protein
MRIHIALALCVSAFLPGSVKGQSSRVQESRSSATIQVLAFSTDGKLLPAPTIEVFENSLGENIAAMFRGGIAEGVPFGEYTIKGHALGFHSETRYVKVYQARATVVLGLAVGGIGGQNTFNLHGRIVGSPLPIGKTLLARLVGVYSNSSVESEIEPNGEFELAGIYWGTYLMLVVSEEGILAARQLAIPSDLPKNESRFEIQLGRDRVP